MSSEGVHYWSTQVDFYNKVKKKRVTGLAKVYIQGQDQFRMDVMDPFGFVKIGTVVVSQGRAKVNFMRQEPYEGPVYDGMFEQMLKVNVSMQDFRSLFTQSDISKKDWACKKNNDETPIVCANENEKLLIQWSGSMKESGTNCKVTHPRADIAIRVKNYRYIDEAKDPLFLL